MPTKTTTLQAFHGSQSTKDKYVARVKLHAELDEIIQGKYWENGKGCAVGCTLHSGDHWSYETELGLPIWLAYLEDRLFEGMSEINAKNFPLRFLEAIPVGAELSNVRTKFLIYLLADPDTGCINSNKPGSKQYNAVKLVVGLLERKLVGGEPSVSEWVTAKNTAYDVASDTSSAAAYAAAYAAYGAAYAAAYSAYAAYATAYAASAAADAVACIARSARKNVYIRMADKLVELLSECGG